MLSTNAPKMLVAAALGAALAWIAADRLSDRRDHRMAALEDGQQAILKELQGLKTQPVRPAAPANVAPPAVPSEPLAIAGAASLGRNDAPLTLIEFSDFQCPFCLRHVRQTFDKIRSEYVDTGKVRYVFRQFPIQSLHAQAWDGARAAECAGQQGKFWEMHSRLFANPKQMGPADLEGHARDVGLQQAAFKQCMSDAAVTAKITKDLDEGARAGVSGTPMFFVGTIENGKVKVLRRLNGAVPYSAFQQTFDSLLQSPPTGS